MINADKAKKEWIGKSLSLRNENTTTVLNVERIITVHKAMEELSLSEEEEQFVAANFVAKGKAKSSSIQDIRPGTLAYVFVFPTTDYQYC